MSCQVGNTVIQQGQTVKLTKPVMAADVVFVVEEKMCNYDTQDTLPQLAKLIENSLSASSYSSVRFGLVGFGGASVHSPSHTHTMDSKLFAARAEFSLGTSALKFSSGMFIALSFYQFCNFARFYFNLCTKVTMIDMEKCLYQAQT